MPVPFVAETGTTIVSPPQSSGDKLLLLKLFLDPIDIGAGQIDLVDRHHDLHLRRRFRVADRFQRLRHQSVIGRDHEDHDVGDIARRARAWR